tara:strand:+ start:249 stop:548 length:300 start_codon:yes stop_codon:yes gene_type:complete
VIDKSETPCAINKKTSGQSMTVHDTLPSLKILIDITKQYAYILTPTSGVIRRCRVRHNEIHNYEKYDLPLKDAINYMKRKPLSLTAFNEIKKLEKKINA